MLVGRDNKVRVTIFKSSIRLTIQMYTAKDNMQLRPDFHLDYWQFIFGSKRNLKLYGGELLEQIKKVVEGMGLKVVETNHYTSIDDDTMYNSGTTVETFIMMDLTKLKE